jgi:predicted ABC-type ATPase
VAELWIVAGPNGAGKTTLVQRGALSKHIAHVTFLNPDDIALAMLRKRGFETFADAEQSVLERVFLEAADAVMETVESKVETGAAVGVETVLSSDKYRIVVDRVLKQDGFFGLIYVWLDSPETACARVRTRVRRGGHDVPTEKIAARWKRSIENLIWFLPRATRFWIFDNTNSDPDVAPVLLAEGGRGRSTFVAEAAPAILLSVLPN